MPPILPSASHVRARLYSDLASWWPLFSHPDRHEEEAEWLLGVLDGALGRKPRTLLELGAGGGNTASHLGRDLTLTLVDAAPAMLAVSRALNPNATHVEGDMRSVRLGAHFDVVTIHDAIMYMTSEADLVAALATARAHVAPDGIVAVLPDYVAETFRPHVETGGHDAADGRGIRYISWIQPPAPGGATHCVDLALVLRRPDGSTEVVHDRHTFGLFSRAQWRAAFEHAGFATPTITPDWWQRDVFLAKPA